MFYIVYKECFSNFPVPYPVLLHNSSRNRNLSNTGRTWWHCPNGCGRKYVRKWNVRRHLTLECGVPKQFKCSICGREFTQKESLKTHMGMQHLVIM